MKQDWWLPFFVCVFHSFMATQKINLKGKKTWIVEVACINFKIWIMLTSTFRATEKYEIMLNCLFLSIFSRSGNFKSLYWNIIAQTNQRLLGFSKIHSFCFMVRFFDRCSSFEHFCKQQGKKHSEFWAHKAKTSTVTPTFYGSFWMSYKWLTVVPSLKKKLESTFFSRELP